MMTTASANRILLDTSVWIEYFRKSKVVFEHIESLIENERICIINFIAAEILQGARSDEEFSILKEAIHIFHFLEEQPNAWLEAAQLSSQLRRKHAPVGLGDCYIAVMASQYQVLLWSFDKHFQTIKNHFPLKLYKG